MRAVSARVAVAPACRRPRVIARVRSSRDRRERRSVLGKVLGLLRQLRYYAMQERDDWLVWALLATLAALVPAVLYARVRPNLRPRGALLATGVCTAAGSALIAAFLPTITLSLIHI